MRHLPSRFLCLLLVSALAVAAATTPTDAASTDNWPGWRGDGDGVSSETGLPVQWDAKTNIKWKRTLQGEGNSSPIVWGDRIFLAASSKKGAMRHIIGLNAANGAVEWIADFPATRKTKTYPKTGYAAATPVTDGERVYAFFDSPGLVAVDFDGKPAWEAVDLGPFTSHYNMAASPVLCDDLVIQVCDHQKGSFIVAVDKATGRQRWRTARPLKANSATPTVIEVNGAQQIVVPGETIIAYDPADGKVIWQCEGMKPYVTPTAVYDGRHVYVTSGRNGPSMAIDPTGRGDVTKTHVAMHILTGGPYVPSPILYPNLILPNDNGTLRAVDKAGRVVAKHRVKGKFSGSPVAADGKLYWTSEKGDTYVIDTTTLQSRSPQLEVVSVNSLGEKVLATAAIAGGRIYIRTSKRLYCIAGDSKTAGAAKAARTMPDTFDELVALHKSNIGKGRAWAGEDDQDATARLEVLTHMAQTCRTAEAAEFIGRAADKDGHWDVREEAAKLLGLYGSDAERPCIHLMTVRDSRGRQTRPYQRIIAAGHLGAMRSAAATDALLANADDKTAEIRAAVIAALGQIAGAHEAPRSHIAPALVKALDDSDGVVVRAGIEAVAGLGGQLGSQQQAIATKLGSLTAGEDRLVAEAASEALKEINGAK